MPGLTPLEIAQVICKKHGMFIVEVTQGDAPAFVLYRRATVPGGKSIRIGRRKDSAEMLRLVQTAAGVVA